MGVSKGIGGAELLRQQEAKQISAQEFAQDLIQRDKANAHLNAISHFDPDMLLTNAKHCDDKRASGTAGSLCGLPILAKDNINTVSFPTTAGTGALRDHTPAQNAGAVRAIEAQDAFIGAKAGMHELAFGITSNNATTGAVRNPHDPDKIPGGSSGGVASGVAAGVFPIGLGTDTGASVRLPAALCGCYGFRPTVGRYAGDGVVPISHTRDTVGPIANAMEDIVLMDAVLAGTPTATQNTVLNDVVLGLPTALLENLEPEVEHAIQSVIKTLQTAGARFVDVDLTEVLALNEQVGFPVALYEVMRDLPEYLATHAPNVSFEEVVAQIGSPDVAGVFASQMGTDAMPEAAYRAAMDVHRPAMQAAYTEIFKTQGLTALLFPTSPLRARAIGEDETVELNGAQVPTMGTFIRNTDAGSNIAAPGISLPCPDVSGLPIGLELDGLPNQDESLLALALAVDQALFH